MNTSDPTPAAADPIVARLRADATEAVAGGMVLVAAGVGATLVSVFAATVLLWLLFGVPGIGFSGWFVLLLVLYVAAAVGWWRSRRGLTGTAAFTYLDPRQDWARPGTFAGRYAAFWPALDVFFFGPRMTLSGLEQSRGSEPASRAAFFDRCALLLRQLGRAGEAQPWDALTISDEETPAKLRPVLGYLDRTGWTGMSSDGGRVWLSSRAKVDLPKLGVLPVTDAAVG